MFPGMPEAGWEQLKEYTPTFLTEFAVMASQIIVYKLAAHFLGKQGFSEYAVARRGISTISPVCLIGLTVALPRYIASCARDDDPQRHDRFFGAALWCVGLTVGLIVGLMNLLPAEFAYLIYGTGYYQVLIVPMSMIIAGLSLHSLAYSYFRGHLQMTRANILQLSNLGVVPLLAFFSGVHSVVGVLYAVGLFSLAVSFVALFFAPWREVGSNSFAEARILLRYGVPRVPGDFAQMALLGLPAFLVAHQSGVEAAGSVAFGIAILSMIGAAFCPIGLVLLPKASRMIADDARTELRQHVGRLIKATLFVGICLTALFFIIARPLIHLYLGPAFDEMAWAVQILSLAALPLSLYYAVRGVVDAHHARAINSLNNLIALSVFLGLAFLPGTGPHPSSIIAALVISVWVLGILTMLEVRRILNA